MAADIYSPYLSMVLCGIRRKQAQPHTRRPISYTLLQQILDHIQHSFIAQDHTRAMLQAAVSLAFHGLLRVSEFTSPTPYNTIARRTLSRKDIRLQSKISMTIHLRASKTDQKHQGNYLVIGATGTSTCPVHLMRRYLTICNHHHTKPHLPLFHFPSHYNLTAPAFTKILRECIRATGRNPKHYASHSLRIGGATAAAAAGIPPTTIKELGRWKSDCYLQYTRVPNANLAKAAARMASTAKEARNPGRSHPLTK